MIHYFLRTFSHLLLTLALVCSAIPASQAQVATCSTKYFLQGVEQAASAADQAVVQAGVPTFAGPTNVECSFLKTVVNGETIYFVVYDFVYSHTRSVFVSALSVASNNAVVVRSSLPAEEVLTSEGGFFGVKLKEFPIPDRSQFVFQVGFPQGAPSNIILLLAWNGSVLRAVGPDYRNVKGVPVSPRERGWFDEDLKAWRDNDGSVYVETAVDLEAHRYKVPTNIYEPWALTSHAWYLGDKFLDSSRLEETDDRKVEQLPGGQLRLTEVIGVAGVSDSDESAIFKLEYPNPSHVPSLVTISTDENIVYQKPDNGSTGAFSRRVNTSGEDWGTNTQLVVEGEEDSVIRIGYFEPLCDINQDGYIDSRDLGLIQSAFESNADIWDHKDQNGDGIINAKDKSACENQCRSAGCAIVPLEVPASSPSNVSSLISMTSSGEKSTLDRQTRKITSTVTITIRNSSMLTLLAPLHALIEITANGPVEVPGAHGGPTSPPYNNYYFDLSSQLANGTLAPNQSVSFVLKFVRAATITLTYRVIPFAVSN